MKIAIVYSSITGNTEEGCKLIQSFFRVGTVQRFRIAEFNLEQLNNYDAIIVGTYTWGNGDIPVEMLDLYHAFEKVEVKHIVTGVFGTGDQLYPHFCGAVDKFRDMLFIHTTLAATLKIEVAPQLQDLNRCHGFVQSIKGRLQHYAR
ncbi:flavodoxin domain-containing protein [Bacillus sp. Marseille-P3661]|uniref:flavodoxin domain-containing protein n=1 Tax=Bacillus sp. Marseille-P3661 TaxID=1936234 RepID=UPI000C85E5EE|nr:flavodoxin domain-containing protein [Bacillus sp. Marseille-P3661]